MSKLGYLHALNSSVFGFEKIFDTLEKIQNTATVHTGYPPYNVRKINSTELMIEVAVAGFQKEEIDIQLENGKLTVTGKKNIKPGTEYLYQGIANRTFIREYTLADTIVVKNASLIDGILYILLENIIPEEKKPRKIEISEIPLTSKQELLLEEKKTLAEETAEKI